MKSCDLLVLSFKLPPAQSRISNFEFRISNLPPESPMTLGSGGRELKTQDSKLKTDGIAS